MKKVPIPPGMQKFYGTGTMLHPDEDMVSELLLKIPPGKLVTIDQVCQQMASQYQTDVACPMRTTNMVKSISKSATHRDSVIPFWRVIRKNHQLINSPMREFCVANLRREGFEVKEDSKGQFKVSNAEEGLHSFV